MGWPSKAAASLFFGAATESGLAPRLETVPISAHQPTKRTTQSRNVVCLRRRIADAAPEVRRCAELAHDDAAMAQDVFRRDHARDRHRRGPRRSADMWSCDLHASDLPLALLLSVERLRCYRG